jgi:hypothetical protein
MRFPMMRLLLEETAQVVVENLANYAHGRYV